MLNIVVILQFTTYSGLLSGCRGHTLT